MDKGHNVDGKMDFGREILGLSVKTRAIAEDSGNFLNSESYLLLPSHIPYLPYASQG